VKLGDALISGMLLGLSGLLVRMVMSEVRITVSFIASFIFNPLSWIAIAAGLTAFFYLQRALYRKKISYVVPIVSALSIVTPVVLSVVFLNEYVPLIRWLGIGLILVGVVGISKEKDEDGMISGLFKYMRRIL